MWYNIKELKSNYNMDNEINILDILGDSSLHIDLDDRRELIKEMTGEK